MSKKKIVLGVIGIIILIAIVTSGGSKNKPANSSTAPATTASTAKEADQPKDQPFSTAASFDNGTHQVGSEIQAGTYRTTGKDASDINCYWSRLSGFTGDLSEILANSNAGKNEPQIVTILPTDKGFKTDGCGKWYKELKQVTTSKTSFGDGMFAVNVDLEPGTYKNSGAKDQYSCYWSRLSGFTGDLDEILANDNTQNAVVTISPSDVGFKSSGCGTWTKQ